MKLRAAECEGLASYFLADDRPEGEIEEQVCGLFQAIQDVDTVGACRIMGEIEGDMPSVETLRRWPIPYRCPGRKRIYAVADVVAHARRRFERAEERRARAVPRRPAAAPPVGEIP